MKMETKPLEKHERPYGLTSRQMQFCHEYIVDLNATQSAIRSGYSKRSASEIGLDNLKKPGIMAYIEDLQRARAEKLEITQEEMLKKLIEFAECDITETLTMDPQDIKQLPKPFRLMVASYKRKRQKIGDIWVEEVELKFIDKVKIIDMINRHIGFYEADNKQVGDNVIIVKPKRQIDE